MSAPPSHNTPASTRSTCAGGAAAWQEEGVSVRVWGEGEGVVSLSKAVSDSSSSKTVLVSCKAGLALSPAIHATACTIQQ
jgi:hypothetical protein